MVNNDHNANTRRFRFIRNKLTEKTPIEQTEIGFTKSTTDIISYINKFEQYLLNIAQNPGVDEDCPFCTFEIDLHKQEYNPGGGVEKFVADTATHEALWELGHVLTYNPSGWHLINELFFPRVHKPTSDYINADLKSVITHSLARWNQHQSGLERYVLENPYYHALVFQSGYGQSVSHAHAHCYTSNRNKERYVDQRGKLTSLTMKDGDADVWVVPFDHPRMVIDLRFDTQDTNAITSMIDGLVTASLDCYRRLFNFEPPHGLGVFLHQSFAEGSVVLHPMQRRGTIQEFQKATFHKFSIDSIRGTFGPVFSETIEAVEGIEEV